jgi:hypothetical protein
MQIVQNVFGKDCKNHHILKKNSHMSPYLDNEFLFIVNTRQDLKQLYLIVWPLGKCGSFLIWMMAMHLHDKTKKNL